MKQTALIGARPGRLAIIGALLLVFASWGLYAPPSAAVTLGPHMLYAPFGPHTLANLGQDVAGAGDVNHDGTPDFIAGMVSVATDDPDHALAARVYSGATGAMLWQFGSADSTTRSANTVTGLGDMDGDGFDDLAVGTPNALEIGAVRVFSGQTAGLLVQHPGEALGDAFGSAIAGVDDVDGDTRPELLVGAPGNDAADFNAGRAYLVSGISKQAICVLDGHESEEAFGTSVDGVGDVTGDGRGDFVVGAAQVGVDKIENGRVYLYAGGLGNCQLLHIWEGQEPGDSFGFAVANAGDLTGDGIAEVIVGAPQLAREQMQLPAAPGRAYVFSAAAADAYAGLYRFTGAAPNDLFGYSVGGDGQCDGDPTPDLIVGAPQVSTAAPFTGAAYLFSGKNGDRLVLFEGHDRYDLFGTNVAWVGQLTGQHPSDELVIGAPGSDQDTISAVGVATVLSCQTVPKPAIELDPVPLSFHDTAPGVPLHGTLTIRNVGDADLKISQIELVDAVSSPDYQISNPAALTIPPSSSAAVDVIYSPATAGADLGMLQIVSNDLDEPERFVALSGQAVAPDIAVDPLTIDCGVDCALGAAKSTIVTITNAGNEDLKIDGISFTAGSSPAFTLLSVPVLPSTLAAGHALNLTVVFTPVDTNPANGTLAIASNDPDEPLVQVALAGSATSNIAPVAHARYELLNVSSDPPRTFQFSSSDSSDEDGTIASYFWEFGDGTTSNAANPKHIYAADGSYLVLLTVTDDQGSSDQTSVLAEASNQPIRSRFYGTALQDDGTALPEGLVITAYIAKSPRATTYIQAKTGESLYAVQVPGSAADQGLKVQFGIGNCPATVSGVWNSQSDVELPLVFEAGCIASLRRAA